MKLNSISVYGSMFDHIEIKLWNVDSETALCFLETSQNSQCNYEKSSFWNARSWPKALEARALGTECLSDMKIFHYILKISFKSFLLAFSV